MRKLVISLLLLTISIYSKEILNKVGTYDLGKLKTHHTKTTKSGIEKFTRNRELNLKSLGKNYLNLYNTALNHYDEADNIPNNATFHIFNLETKEKEIIKLPLKNFINNNKELFINQGFLKTHKKQIKLSIEIIHYSKEESGYLLSEYNIKNYSTVYVHWRHKSNIIWGYDLNQFDTKNKAKVIDYDKENHKLYFYTACRDKNPKINLLNLNTKTRNINFMINHKINSKQKEKNLHIKSVHAFENYNKFLFLEYSESKKRQAKGYFVYKKSNIPRTIGYQIKTFDIPLTVNNVDISKDCKKLFITSSKNNLLISYDLKTLKILNKVKINSEIHNIFLFDNDNKLMTFHNTVEDPSKQGINIYETEKLKQLEYDKTDLGYHKFFAQYMIILKKIKQIILYTPEKSGFPLKDKLSIFQYK